MALELYQTRSVDRVHALSEAAFFDEFFYKVAVFIDGHFGIFRSFEFAVLGGVMVRERAALGETVSSVLRRYGVDIPEPDSS